MVVEIAYDATAARRAWAENVPAVVSGGQSGSCPGGVRVVAYPFEPPFPPVTPPPTPASTP